MCLGDGHKTACIHRIFTAPNRNPSLIVRRATYEKRAMECGILVVFGKCCQDFGIKPDPFAQELQQPLELFLDDLSNPGPAVRLYGEGPAIDRRSLVTEKREIMPQYLLAGYQPRGCDRSSVDEATGRATRILYGEQR